MSTAQAAREPTTAIHVPPVLPVVAMTVADDGAMTVTVDGVPFEPPRFGPPWVRASFAQIIDSVIDERGTPVRVVVYEADGAVFTDLITRPLRASLDARARRSDRHPTSERVATAPPTLIDAAPFITAPRVALGEDGFLPGEEVAVAIIVRHTKAAADGSARALLEPGICRASTAGEVVLVGRISGTCIIGQLA